MGESRAKATADQKEHKGSSHICQKNLDYPQDFWANILWTDETKVELFGRCVSRYIWLKTNIWTSEHHTNSQTVKHGGGSVMVWLLCSFRTWMIAIIDGTILHSIRKSWRRMSGCQFVTSNALGLCSRTMIPHTSNPPLSGSRKTKLRFWSGQVKVRA